MRTSAFAQPPPVKVRVVDRPVHFHQFWTVIQCTMMQSEGGSPPTKVCYCGNCQIIKIIDESYMEAP